jgi:hypothetical protein
MSDCNAIDAHQHYACLGRHKLVVLHNSLHAFFSVPTNRLLGLYAKWLGTLLINTSFYFKSLSFLTCEFQISF